MLAQMALYASLMLVGYMQTGHMRAVRFGWPGLFSNGSCSDHPSRGTAAMANSADPDVARLSWSKADMQGPLYQRKFGC